MSQINTLKDKMALLRARANRVSPLIALSSFMLRDNLVADYIILPAACGDNLPPTTAFRQPMPLQTRITVAKILAKSFKNANSNLSDEASRAHCWGQLFVTWSNNYGTTIESQRSYLDVVVRTLKDCSGTGDIYKKWLYSLFGLLRKTKGTVSKAKIINIHPKPNSVTHDLVSEQSYYMFASLGHAIRIGDILNLSEDWKKCLQLIKECPEVYTKLPENNPELHPDWRDKLNTWNNEQILALHSVEWIVNRSELVDTFLSGFAALMMSISKPKYLPKDWFTYRLPRITTALKGLSLADLDDDSINIFSTKYMNPSPSVTDLSKVLTMAFATLKETSPESICWLIEQAASRNMTYALLIGQANIATQGRYLTTVWRLIPAAEKKSLAELTGMLYMDRWKCLLTPYKEAESYSDLANAAVQVLIKLKKVRKYPFKFLPQGTLAFGRVRALADLILSLEDQVLEFLSYSRQFYYGNKVHLYIDPPRNKYIYLRTLLAATTPDSSDLYFLEPRLKVTLPSNFFQTPKCALHHILREEMKLDKDILAFETVLAELAYLRELTPLEPFAKENVAVHVVARKIPLDPALANAIRHFSPDFVKNTAGPLEAEYNENTDRLLYEVPDIQHESLDQRLEQVAEGLEVVGRE